MLVHTVQYSKPKDQTVKLFISNINDDPMRKEKKIMATSTKGFVLICLKSSSRNFTKIVFRSNPETIEHPER